MKIIKTYKLTKIVSIFVMTLLIAFGAHAAPELNAGTISGKAGDIVELPITFINDGTVVGMQFDVVLPSSFTIVAPLVKRGPAIPFSEDGLFSFNKALQTKNSVRTIIQQLESPPKAIPSDGNNGLVLVKVFILIGEESVGENVVSLTNVVFANGEAENVPPTSIAVGSITVIDKATSTGVTLPNVIGFSKSVAKSTLEGLGLAVSMISQKSKMVPAGQVVIQAPAASETVSAGSTVVLHVSSGQVVASTEIKLSVGEVTGQVGDIVKLPITFINDGTITSMDFDIVIPTGFTATPPLVERGPAIPLVEGNTHHLQSKISSFENNAVTIFIRSEFPFEPIRSDGNNGLVLVTISVRIDEETMGENEVYLARVVLANAENNTVDPDSILAGSISVIEKSAPIEVNTPDLGVGSQTEGAAISILKNLGLRVTTTSINSETHAAGFVIGQTPAAGEVVSVGSTVELILSQGPINDGKNFDAGVSGEPIPTLSFWGLLGLSALMPGIVGWVSKKKKSNSLR